ncbi:Copine-6 [Seminavis robusta]|uniref:Copine-6 n=1 Tax=Seminavis robusta TaxID=568900 RepID=A0A9N8DY87_9STRA|nr:Copine-6 [Seminavis robusta]|eukprot:Sro337_g120500.1 Copine-6 (792) ;mRNA; f:6097-8688
MGECRPSPSRRPRNRRGMMRSSSTGTGLGAEYAPSATSQFVATSPTNRSRRLELGSVATSKSGESLDDIGVSGVKPRVHFARSSNVTHETDTTGISGKRSGRRRRLSVTDAGQLASQATKKFGATVEKAGGLAAKLKRGALSNFALKKISYDNGAAWNARLASPLVHVNIQVSCRNLPHRTTRQVNAFAVIWKCPNGYTGHLDKAKGGRMCPLPRNLEHEIGRTEVVRNSQNPIFLETFKVQYKFEEQQTFLIRIYDEDLGYTSDLKEHDFLGGYVFTLGSLMGHPQHKIFTTSLDPENPDACLILQGRELDTARKFLEFRFTGYGLSTSSESVLKTTDPFFMLETWDEDDGEWHPLWKSEVIFHEHNPKWATASLSLLALCGGNLDENLRITFWSSGRHHADEYLGFVDTTVRDLGIDTPDAEEGVAFPIKIRKKVFFGAGSRLQKAGTVHVVKASIVDKPTFLQYIHCGWEINLVVAVDCAASLSHNKENASNQFQNGASKNKYQRALDEIGTLMEPYSRSQYFRMWGFNAQVSMDDNDNVFVMNDKVAGSKGLVRTYSKYFLEGNRFISRHKASHVAPLITKAIFQAIEEKEKRGSYTLLCILTSGHVTDLEATVDAVHRAATDAPISIAFIGCEDDNNLDKTQQYFDKTKVQRSISGIRISRDVAAFTSFAEFGNDASHVIAEGLRELPEQMIQRFFQSGIDPSKPVAKIDRSLNVHKERKKDPSHHHRTKHKSPPHRQRHASPHHDKQGSPRRGDRQSPRRRNSGTHKKETKSSDRERRRRRRSSA